MISGRGSGSGGSIPRLTLTHPRQVQRRPADWQTATGRDLRLGGLLLRLGLAGAGGGAIGELLLAFALRLAGVAQHLGGHGADLGGGFGGLLQAAGLLGAHLLRHRRQLAHLRQVIVRDAVGLCEGVGGGDRAAQNFGELIVAEGDDVRREFELLHVALSV
ncbi:hypothetical protein [Nonomuraea rubra]|uniref:hypothetical protein n=1 Tax=Nonomuraea rubra TaxID=46180 RepID=UPI0033C8E277